MTVCHQRQPIINDQSSTIKAQAYCGLMPNIYYLAINNQRPVIHNQLPTKEINDLRLIIDEIGHRRAKSSTRFIINMLNHQRE